jgi:hypothetical protein
MKFDVSRTPNPDRQLSCRACAVVLSMLPVPVLSLIAFRSTRDFLPIPAIFS